MAIISSHRFMKNVRYLLFVIQVSFICNAQTLNLPPRPNDAPTGSDFAQILWNLTLTDRENAIFIQIMNGNVPDFQKNLVPITFTQLVNGTQYQITYYSLSDYMAVGCDTNYFLIPMTPILAQKLCNNLKCTLPTRKMVNQIWSYASVKLEPAPIPPSDTMTTVPVMWQHNQIVWQQRQAVIGYHPLGELVGGDKKDVVVSNLIYGYPPPNRVVIYGWHYLNGTPIQPLYNGHSETYVDYSHGIRLVQDSITINGQPGSITDILQNDSLHVLFSDEGKISIPFYPLSSSSTNPTSVWAILSNGLNSLKLQVYNDPTVTHYIAHLSADGKNFTRSLLLEKLNPVINELETDSIYYIKLQAVGADTSNFSEVLAGVPSGSKATVLIVNGFDRSYTGNTYNFVRMHGPAVKNYGYSFDSATNETIYYSMINLEDYEIVDWILGTESTINETFSSAEQNYVSAFLKKGGALFVSGSEIAWDLDYKGSTTDKSFFGNYLKAEYIADAPNNLSNTYYTAEGIAGSVFEEIKNITFDNGTHGTYNVSWPDVINGKNGGVNVLKYSGLASANTAGVVYKGLFPGGANNGGLVYFGFPFETIYPESKRFEVMSKVLDYLSDLTDMSDNINYTPQEYVLYQNYPNPFNPSTIISWQIPEAGYITIVIFDVLGRRIKTLINEYKQPGKYEISFNAADLSSGVYYYQLKTENYKATNKMMVIK